MCFVGDCKAALILGPKTLYKLFEITALADIISALEVLVVCQLIYM